MYSNSAFKEETKFCEKTESTGNTYGIDATGYYHSSYSSYRTCDNHMRVLIYKVPEAVRETTKKRINPQQEENMPPSHNQLSPVRSLLRTEIEATDFSSFLNNNVDKISNESMCQEA